MARSNPYYARKAKRQADAARNVERIYRDLDNQKWARDFVDNLYGPLAMAGTICLRLRPSRRAARGARRPRMKRGGSFIRLGR